MKIHKQGCLANASCLVVHLDGVCPGPYGKCTCGGDDTNLYPPKIEKIMFHDSKEIKAAEDRGYERGMTEGSCKENCHESYEWGQKEAKKDLLSKIKKKIEGIKREEKEWADFWIGWRAALNDILQEIDKLEKQ